VFAAQAFRLASVRMDLDPHPHRGRQPRGRALSGVTARYQLTTKGKNEMRSYDEPIEVRRGLVAGAEAPAQFLWRDRLWMVQDVQTRWTETGAWWDGPAARALRGESADEEGDLLAEEEVWRVVAGQGRAGHLGVYELAHAWGTGQWRLRSVLD
jgi:hypothetical protein